MTGEQLRWLWTIVSGLGMVFGLAAGVLILWLYRQAQRDVWALSQVLRPGIAVLQMSTEGDRRDLRTLGIVVTFWTLAVSAQFGAGLAALVTQGSIALVLLVASEVLGVLGLVALVVLAVLKHSNRNAIRRAIQLDRKKASGGS